MSKNLFGFLAGPYALLPNIVVYNRLFAVDQVISKKTQEGQGPQGGVKAGTRLAAQQWSYAGLDRAPVMPFTTSL